MQPDPSDDIATCSVCGAEMFWEDCWKGCDDGYFDEYDCDPVNFTEGDEMTPCDECHGKGGYLTCSALPHSDEQMRAWRERTEAR